MVARLTELGALRDGLDPDRATDLVVVLFGHDVFRSLVSEAGWNVPAYKAWLFTTLVQQLLQQQRLAPTGLLGPLLRQPVDEAVGPRGQSAPIWSRIVLRTQRVYWSSDQPRSMTRFL